MMIKRNIFAILTALAATTLLAAGCGGDVECGPGTTEKDGKCIAKAAAEETCGAGTVLADGKCVLNESGCGTGTTLGADGTCIASADSCGDGTTLDTATGQCLANSNILCGAGTVDVDGKCKPAADACTKGTKLEDGKCVIAPAACGDGTALDANTAICEPSAEACGEGLALTGGKCVPTAEVCATGTTFNDDTGICLPDATCKIGDEIIDGICLSPAEALFNHPDAKDIDGAPVLAMPAIDERLIFTGTINKPVEEADGTFTNNVDKFSFAGEAGQYIKLTLQALNSVDLVFEVKGPETTEYIRTSSVGVEVVPARYVYIPYDGEYTVTVQPSFGWFIDLNAEGGEGFEFAGTLEQVEAPTAADLTLDKVVAAELAGNSRALLSNLYKFGGSASGDLVTFTLADFGVDASSSVLVLSNDAKPAVIKEHLGLAKGDSFSIEGSADGFQILVDNNLVAGPKTNFDISGLINGVIKTAIIDAGDTDVITGTVAPNTILKVMIDGDAETKLEVSVLDSHSVQLGKAGTIEDGESFFMFYSEGGAFTINLKNILVDAINTVAKVEFIAPKPIGAIAADSKTTITGDAIKVGQDHFFLLDVTAPNQVLDFMYQTGKSYTSYEEILADLFWGDIWNENGSKADTTIFQPGFKLRGTSYSGQFMAVRVGNMKTNEFCIRPDMDIICNTPYNRAGYEIEVTVQTAGALPDDGAGFDSNDVKADDVYNLEADLVAPLIIEEKESIYYQITVTEPVEIFGYVDAADGILDLGIYDEDMYEVMYAEGDYGDEIEGKLFPGTYFIEVFGFEKTTTGFDLFLMFDEITTIPFAAAVEITDFTAQIASNSREGNTMSQHKFYKVKFAATTSLNIKATHVSGGGWMKYQIYAANGYEVLYAPTTFLRSGAATSTTKHTFDANKEYYIQVGGGWGANPNSYNDPYNFTLNFEILP